jgi:hypothetical protein
MIVFEIQIYLLTGNLLLRYWKHEYIAHFNKRTVEKHLEVLFSCPISLSRFSIPVKRGFVVLLDFADLCEGAGVYYCSY